MELRREVEVSEERVDSLLVQPGNLMEQGDSLILLAEAAEVDLQLIIPEVAVEVPLKSNHQTL